MPTVKMINSPFRVVLVEPRKRQRSLLAEGLRQQGLIVVAVQARNQIAQVLSTGAVDTIIADTRTPRALLTQLARIAGNARTPILLEGPLEPALANELATVNPGILRLPSRAGAPLQLKDIRSALRQESKHRLTPTVCVVDGDPTVRTLLTSLFRRENYQSLAFASLKEGRQRLRNDPYVDLLVIEIFLPDGSGHELVKEVRKQSLMPVIMLSQTRDPLVASRSFASGANDVVWKPLDPRDLLVRVEHLLG